MFLTEPCGLSLQVCRWFLELLKVECEAGNLAVSILPRIELPISVCETLLTIFKSILNAFFLIKLKLKSYPELSL